VEVVALCDLLEERAQAQAEVVRKKTGQSPAVYFGDENASEKARRPR
jgi:hypothetical protein